MPWEREARDRGEVKGLEQGKSKGAEWGIVEGSISLGKFEKHQISDDDRKSPN